MPRVTPITTKEQVAPEHRTVFDAVAEGQAAAAGETGVREPFEHPGVNCTTAMP